jgi:hypothetical protein
MSTIAVLVGFRAGIRRASHPAALGGALLAILASLLIGLGERQSGLLGAASRALEGGVFGLVLPLAVLSTSVRVIASRLDIAGTPLARFGPSRRGVAGGLVLSTMALSGALGVLLAGTAASVAHDPTTLSLAADVTASGWIAALTASAYAGLYALGSTFGSRGGGRTWALVFDFAFGGTGQTAALFFPRGHAANLLGGEPPMMLPQWASAGFLAALTVGFGWAAVRRCRP